MEFSQPDATEKDDSKEKENLSKDDSSAEDRSPLDMDYNKLETKLDLEEGDAELAEIESQSDSAPLLEKQDNKDSNAEEGTKDTKDRAREKRKGKNRSQLHSCSYTSPFYPGGGFYRGNNILIYLRSVSTKVLPGTYRRMLPISMDITKKTYLFKKARHS